MLRIHFLQNWFNLSDPAMEEALYDTPMFREFVGLDMGEEHLPDESTILRFRHLLETHNLGVQILATVNATAANAHDITQASQLLHGQETDVFADSGYRGVEKREEIQAKHPQVNWHIAMMPGKHKAMDKSTPMGVILDKLEQTKARIQAKVEHPFRVIKRQFGYVKVKYRGVAKNTANLVTLFALSNLWMAQRRLFQGGRDECYRNRPKGRESDEKRLEMAPCMPRDAVI